MPDLQRAQLNVYNPQVVFCIEVGGFSLQEVAKWQKNVKKIWVAWMRDARYIISSSTAVVQVKKKRLKMHTHSVV